MPNKMERFTQMARRALSDAQQASVTANKTQITLRHLLIGLAQPSPDESVASRVLHAVGLSKALLQAAPDNAPSTSDLMTLELSGGVKRVLEKSVGVAREREEGTIATAHLLAALLQMPTAPDLFTTTDVTIAQVQAALDDLDDWTTESATA